MWCIVHKRHLVAWNVLAFLSYSLHKSHKALYSINRRPAPSRTIKAPEAPFCLMYNWRINITCWVNRNVQSECEGEEEEERKKNYNFPSAFRVSANLFIIQNRSKSSMRYIRYKGEHEATPTFHIHPRKTEEKPKGGYLKGTWIHAISDSSITT